MSDIKERCDKIKSRDADTGSGEREKIKTSSGNFNVMNLAAPLSSMAADAAKQGSGNKEESTGEGRNLVSGALSYVSDFLTETLCMTVLIIAIVAASFYGAYLILLSSPFGVFFGGNAKDEGITVNDAVYMVYEDFSKRIEELEYGYEESDVSVSGSASDIRQVLTVYLILSGREGNAKPYSFDNDRLDLLFNVFYMFNEIETSKYEERLEIRIRPKTAGEVYEIFSFSEKEKKTAEEMLGKKMQSAWQKTLFLSSGELAAIAREEIGNAGGEKYWSWYGFPERVEWCACFVSWCADRAGLIQSGAVPMYDNCYNGIIWFKERGTFEERDCKPGSGDIIFFDWDGDGKSDHTGIVEHFDGKTVYTIEGNSGDTVRQGRYDWGAVYILGYGNVRFG